MLVRLANWSGIWCDGSVPRDHHLVMVMKGYIVLELDHETSLSGTTLRGMFLLNLDLKTPSDVSQGFWMRLWLSRLLQVYLSFYACVWDPVPTG